MLADTATFEICRSLSCLALQNTASQNAQFLLQQQVQASCCMKVQPGTPPLTCRAVLHCASCYLQAIMELPPINMAEVLYGQHPKLGDGLICTAVSLAGVLFNFVVMPSLDLLLGKDLHSRTEVRMLPQATPRTGASVC